MDHITYVVDWLFKFFGHHTIRCQKKKKEEEEEEEEEEEKKTSAAINITACKIKRDRRGAFPF